MKRLTRRQALVYLGGIAAAGFTPAATVQAAPSQTVVTAAMKLFARPETRASAALIGQTYLRSHPCENNTETLIRALDFMAGYDLEQGDTAVLARLYAQRISQDFESADVVNVDGWILSKTEARVFGLLALQQTV